MVVCKFFLQGNCKFGDYCKFEHQINDEFSTPQNRGSGSSVLRQSQFVGNQNQYQNPAQVSLPKEKSSATVDEATLIKSVINDMTAVEKGNQWLLSCYSPFRDKPLFPGFEDQSFEEIRYLYYEAAKNGATEQYKQHIQIMLQQAIMRVKSLQNPSPDIANVLKNIYNTPVTSQMNAFSGGNNSGFPSAFNQNPSYGAQGSSIFAQANQHLFNKPQEQQNATGSTFGGPNSNSIFVGQQSNVFSGSGNIFNQANTSVQNNSSIFNNQAVTNSPVQAGQIFNNPAFGNQNAFLSNQEGGSIFAQPGTHTIQPSNIFASQNVGAQPTNIIQPSSIFGNQNVASLQQQTNAFSPPPNTQAQTANSFTQQNIFQAGLQQMNTNVFGVSPPQTSIFGAPQDSSNVFGIAVNQDLNNPSNQQMISNSPFAKSEPQSHTASIFGTSNSFNTVSQPQQQLVIEEGMYSKLEDLTEEQIKWFQSDSLDNFNIPENPPTYEMCFKV